MTTEEIILKNINEKVFAKKSKAEIARILGIKDQSISTIISNLENGGTIKIRTLEKLAAAAELKSYKELL